MSRVADTDLLALPPWSRRAQLEALRSRTRIAPVSAPPGPYDVCFLAIFEADQVRALRYVRNLSRECKRIVVYLFDAWVDDARSLPRHRKLWELCDALFVSFPNAADVYSRYIECPVTYLPQAIDPSRFNPYRRDRPIHVLSMGRRLDTVHRDLLALSKKRDLWYHFSEARAPLAIDLDDSQFLLGRLCQSARIQMCWPIDVTHGEQRRMRFSEADGSPVTARWFEAAACGSVVLGARPAAGDFATLFPFEGFVREIDPGAPDQLEPCVMESLADAADWEERQALAHHVLRSHTWRARCEAILSLL